MSDDSINDAAWAPAPATPAPAAGLLPGYRDFEVVARGGDSIVYRAHQDALDRDVAIKVVLLDDPESVARFRRELEITVRLGRQHPNIMTVLATGTTTSGQPCLVMDYVELGSLHDRLVERRTLPVSEVVAAGSVVADALAFAHGQGVLHRDVKPQNVLVLPTSYVLADFGLARAIDAGHSSSLERFSYRHASPQILDGEAPTVADDVYSLGSTLFTLLDGRPPFAAEDPDEDSALSYLRRARTESPRALVRDDLPDALRDVVLRCLARSRADRFASAGELRDALNVIPTESRTWAPELPGVDAEVPPAEVPPLAALDAPPFADPSTTPAPMAAPLPVAPLPVDAEPVAAEPVAAKPVDAERVDVAALPATDRDADEVAVSALAHLTAAPTGTGDADSTGIRPVEPPDTPPGPPSHSPPPRRGARWIWIAAATVVALGIGVLVGFLRAGGDGSPKHDAHRSSTHPPVVQVPSVDTLPVGPSGKLTVDPRLAPRITTLKRTATDRAQLVWTDPSNGKFPFVIFVDKVARPDEAERGTTSVTLTGFTKGRHCVQVWLVEAGSIGKSPIRCI